MTLYLETPSGFVAWTGQPIGEGEEAVCHPLHIEQLWSAGALADWGLYEPAAGDAVPEGKVVTETAVQRVEGVVTFVHTLADLPHPVVEQIKAEAYRRIVEIVPEWKQRNLTAQAVVLAKQIADGVPLTQEQQEAWDAGQTIWQQITAIRTRSDAIEAMSPIPHDFANDNYWTPA
jgi:uncharacterized protein YeaC (DUF1315 family)